MPTFGEYETVGDPIAAAEERNHTSTVWRAVKPGASDGRDYMVKCYAPRRRSSHSPETESLSRDRGLEFLEGIKEQKLAQSSGGRSLAPIHEFGMSEAGAWYVTDYFPRSNLKAWITKKGRVDSAGLRHVVAELVTGCLALKHSLGYSHGNLKVSNVFRAG
jgi:serine/threonine protein kinase